MCWHRSQKLIHQNDIDHRRLVHHEQIEIERLERIALETAKRWIEFEQTVNGLGLAAGGLAQSFGRPSRWSAEGATLALCGENLQDAANNRALADAGAAG